MEAEALGAVFVGAAAFAPVSDVSRVTLITVGRLALSASGATLFESEAAAAAAAPFDFSL